MKKEHIRNVIVASANLVPIAGGLIGVMLDKYLPYELERRKNELINKLSKDLEAVKDKISAEWFESSDFISIYIKLFRRALEDNRKEKVNSFRNILVNVAVENKSDFDEISFFIRLVNDLTIDQIKILHFGYIKSISGHLAVNVEGNIYEEFQKIWPNVDEYYLQSCVNEIARFNLFSSSEKINKQYNTKNKFHFTSLGERFVNYIFTPINFDEE